MILTHLVQFEFFQGATIFGDAPPTPPTPAPAAAQRFGGGPFWSKYGYDSAYDDIREAAEEDETVEAIRDALQPNELRAVDDVVNAAAGAMERGERPALVRDYEAVYRNILRGQKAVRAGLKTAIEARRAFRAEVQKKLEMAEHARIIAYEEEETNMVAAILFDLDR